jgi:hypothetical protein
VRYSSGSQLAVGTYQGHQLGHKVPVGVEHVVEVGPLASNVLELAEAHKSRVIDVLGGQLHLFKNNNRDPGSRTAAVAQLGERETEDLKVTGSIPVRGTLFHYN